MAVEVLFGTVQQCGLVIAPSGVASTFESLAVLGLSEVPNVCIYHFSVSSPYHEPCCFH